MSANLPAFPVPLNPGEAFRGMSPADGLTKRELFAAMVMQGLAADPNCTQEAAAIASLAVAWSDALLAELAKDGAA